MYSLMLVHKQKYSDSGDSVLNVVVAVIRPDAVWGAGVCTEVSL